MKSGSTTTVADFLIIIFINETKRNWIVIVLQPKPKILRNNIDILIPIEIKIL